MLSSPYFSRSLPFVTQIRGHIEGTSSPPPTTVRAFIFKARKSQHFISSSTRHESCIHTLLVGATRYLLVFSFFHPIYHLLPYFLYLSHRRNSDPGHIAGSSPPSSLRFAPLFLSPTSALSSPVNVRRNALYPRYIGAVGS